jgi:lysylphosphatidylglycerol synthetase-like protein (DUF2156 family)
LAAPSDIPDLEAVDVPVGGRAVIMAGLQLTEEPSQPELATSVELAAALEAATGPGALIVAGDLFRSGARPAASLASHPRLTRAITSYAAGRGRRVVVLPGEQDAALAWSAPDQEAIRGLGASLALAAELTIDTGAGVRKVRVEPGHNLDALSRFEDPRNPRETPYAQHIRNELLPSVQRRQGSGPLGMSNWLAGLDQLDDPAAVSRFIASRLVYRRLGRYAWLLAVPVIVALILRLPAFALQSARSGGLTGHLGILAAIAIFEILMLTVLAGAALRSTAGALSALSLNEEGRDPNDTARNLARELVTADYAGLVTGHTCRPELAHLGAGFYANAGCSAQVVTEAPSRIRGLGLPPAFLAHRDIAWVELEAGNELHARLFHARQPLPGASVLERLVTRPTVETSATEGRPEVVATYPQGSPWPRAESTEWRHRRVRRAAAFVVFLAGFLSLLSALAEPVRDRVRFLYKFFPATVPETAAALSALFAIGLIVLARGIRRGQRRAWLVCLLLLLSSSVLHIVKGIDVIEALITLLVAAFLWINRASFQAKTDVARLGRGLAGVAVATVLTVVAGTLAVEFASWINAKRRDTLHRLSWGHALLASLERMVGITHIRLPERLNQFFSPAMATVTAGLVLALLVVLFRPVVQHRVSAAGAGGIRVVGRRRGLFGGGVGSVGSPGGPGGSGGSGGSGGGRPGRSVAPAGSNGSLPGQPVAHVAPAGARGGTEGLAAARAVFARHGSGTLDYFALRPDKEFFFWGNTVVAHAVYGGVCLVSPDPIGPVSEREPAWRAFREYVDSQGWALGGLGIGEAWLPIYRSTGMHDLYVGDEAVVRVSQFTLEGGRFKGLRQAVNRVAKYGYRISFHDPSQLDPAMRSALEDVMTKSRRGDVERGFSMTLGRVFDSNDAGLLLAVVHGPLNAGTDAGEETTAPPKGGKPAATDNPVVAAGDPAGPPVAFCQYVPAPGIGGYSLDLMRRDNGEHPNGLIDFAVVETIRELKRRGDKGLGLNFATMRAVLAGEAGEGVAQRVQAWALRRMGDSMQIESLWKFNAKFDPDWQPRYAIYDAPENMLAVAIAVARAESFWELPVIGRFLVPSVPNLGGPETVPSPEP